MFLSALLHLLVLFSAYSSAQLSLCATTCATRAKPATCEITQSSCLCSNPTFVTTVEACVTKLCTPADLQAVKAYCVAALALAKTSASVLTSSSIQLTRTTSSAQLLATANTSATSKSSVTAQSSVAVKSSATTKTTPKSSATTKTTKSSATRASSTTTGTAKAIKQPSAIIAGVIVGVILLGIIVGSGLFWLRRRRPKHRAEDEDYLEPNPSSPSIPLSPRPVAHQSFASFPPPSLQAPEANPVMRLSSHADGSHATLSTMSTLPPEEEEESELAYASHSFETSHSFEPSHSFHPDAGSSQPSSSHQPSQQESLMTMKAQQSLALRSLDVEAGESHPPPMYTPYLAEGQRTYNVVNSP